MALDILPFDPIPGVIILQQDFSEAGADEKAARCARRAEDPTRSCPTWRPPRPATVKPTISASWVSRKRRSRSPSRFSRRGGAFLAKVFQGGSEKSLLDILKRDFATVRHIKPKASRAESPELYVLATGFRGSAASAKQSVTGD